MIKIVILTGYYYPEITAATHLLLNLAADLVKNNADVTVITAFPSRGINEQTRQQYLKKSKEITYDGIKIIRVGLKSKTRKNFIRRTLRYIINSLAIYYTAKKIKSDIYLIYSTPPFLGLVGTFLSKKSPTVYNLQDIFPESMIRAEILGKDNFIVKLLRIVENHIYKKYNHIITISEDLKKNLLSKRVPEEKISIVYNWIDPYSVIPIMRVENQLVIKYNLEPSDFFVTHCGNIGHLQNLELIIDVAKKLEDNYPDIKFVFIGDGAWIGNIKEYILKKGANNILILPFQPFDNISFVYSLGDVSLVTAKRGVSSCSVPSKTWSIMSAARAVLCSFDENSDLCRIIREANCGICVPSENESDLENALLSLYYNRKKTEKYGINGRKYILRNLTREQKTKDFYEILLKISLPL